MKKVFGHTYPWYALVLAALSIEVLSFVSWAGVSPYFGIVCLVACVVMTAICSLRDLRIGVALVGIELIIGSQGYLFSVSVGGFTVSLRLALFLTVLCVGLIHAIRTRRIELMHQRWFWAYSVVLAVVVYGTVNALMFGRGVSSIFFDANAWLFLGFAFPLAQAVRTRDDVRAIFQLYAYALAWLSVKTLIVFIVFSHSETFKPVISVLYPWLRDTRIAEIFRFDSGFARVFLQSHIYAVLAWIVFFVRSLIQRSAFTRFEYVLYGLVTLAMLISYSRTFWLVMIGVVTLIVCYACVVYRAEWKRIVARVAQAGALIASSVCVLLVLIALPLPAQQESARTGAGFIERVTGTSTEAAAVTRAQQFVPLIEAIQRHPFRGSGFGATVTFTSADPRVLATHADGRYTTAAFELGYLDFLYTFGVPIVIVCGIGAAYALSIVMRTAYVQRDEWKLLSVVSVALFIFGVHALTPYIDHPLGLHALLWCVYVYTLHKSRI